MQPALTRATYSVSEALLERMVLAMSELPPGLDAFALSSSGFLDNHTMAEQGFPGNSADGFTEIGRITGYLAEYRNPKTASDTAPGIDVACGTVVHLFDNENSVRTWIHEVFLKQFEGNVGLAARDGSKLLSVERLGPSDFADEVACVRATQRGPAGPISSTVLDFRVGRLLGVAFVASAGDVERLDLTTELALKLQRQIVSITLSS